MRKIHMVLTLAAILSVQPVFADNAADMAMDASNTKPCATVAKACLDAGFERTEVVGKRFWQDCMKPVVLGQAVKEVIVDAGIVKACRKDKIKELKMELKALKKAD